MALDNPALHYLEAFSHGADQVIFAYEITSHTFAYLHPAFEKVWHRTRKSVLLHPVSLLKTIHPEDRQHVQLNYQELLEGGIIKEIEFRILVHHKTERWISVKPRLLEDSPVIIGSAQDITLQKHYNDTIKKYSDKKNAILNILSHDLAGPLAMIYNLSTVVQEDLRSKGNEEMHQLIGLIERSSKQAMQLVQDFIKQEFLESAAVELVRERVDLVQAISGLIEEYQLNPLIVGKTFHFLPSRPNIYLDLDEPKFIQVINNLISNALKFTPDGGEITLTLEEKEASILLRIADTGIGIPQKYQATLFDKFTPARRIGLKGEPSVGLGMSLIKTIVEWHQGKIWFESQENSGTTFYIEIPKTK
jgi:two-component system, OmpR family, sensor histidine kinase VicK